jgi:periplasmic copper chaperone A
MKTMVLAVASVVLALFGTTGAVRTQLPTNVSAKTAWIKLPALGEETTQAFVVVENQTMYDVYVVSASTEIAETVRFFEPASNPNREPTPVKEVTAPAFGRLEMTPNGVHLQLVGLTRPLLEGEKITLTLMTDGGIALEVPAVVRAK